MRPGRGYNHPPPSTTEIKRRVELYLYSPSGYSWHVLRRNLPVTPAFFFAVSALWVTCSGVLSKIGIYENSVKLYPYFWSVFFYIAISRLLLHDIKWDIARSLTKGEEQTGFCHLPLKCLQLLNNSVDGLWLGMDGLPSQDSYVAPPEHVQEIRTCRFSVTWRHVDEKSSFDVSEYHIAFLFGTKQSTERHNATFRRLASLWSTSPSWLLYF
jgi:hypothetical protein